MREKGELEFFSKKERARMEKEYQRLNDYLDGIRDMKDAPSCMFVVDLNKEHIALRKQNAWAWLLSVSPTPTLIPEIIDFPIPGNDDAIRSI